MTDITTGKEPGEGEAAAYHHPPHYNAHPSGVECIDIVRHMSFNVGSAMKYLWRADLKDAPIEDLEKARWYITDEIERRKKQAYVDVVREHTESVTAAFRKMYVHWAVTDDTSEKFICACGSDSSHYVNGGWFEGDLAKIPPIFSTEVGPKVPDDEQEVPTKLDVAGYTGEGTPHWRLPEVGRGDPTICTCELERHHAATCLCSPVAGGLDVNPECPQHDLGRIGNG